MTQPPRSNDLLECGLPEGEVCSFKAGVVIVEAIRIAAGPVAFIPDFPDGVTVKA